MRLFLLLILFCSVFAQSPFDWDENGIPLRQGTHIEWWKAVEVGLDGEFIIVWSDCRYGIRDIFAQKINSDGELLWGTDGELVALEDGLKDGITIAQANGRQEDPIIISDESGGFYMMWMDYRDEPAKGDIYAQHVLSDGSLQFGLEGTPLTNLPGKQSSPNMCKDNLGGVFAIWKDESDGSAVIKGTHISFDGTILAPGVGIVINDATNSRSGISLEVISDGLAGMTWSRTIPVGAGEEENSDIVIQIMDTNISTLLSPTNEGGIIICDAPFKQTSPKVTYVNGAQFVVTWQDHRDPENYGDIYMQYFDIEGNPILEQNGIALTIDSGEQKKPRAKGDETGAYLVWQDYRTSADNPDVYIQKVGLDGTILLEQNGKAITNFSDSQQINPRLTTDGFGGAFFIWEDYRNGSYPEIDIYIQHLNSNNEFSFGDNGLLVNAENSISPVMKQDGFGGVYTAWDDYRIGSNSIYMQKITPSQGVVYEENGRNIFSGITGNVGDPDTDTHAKSLSVDNDKSLVYWTDNRWAPDLQEVTFGMILDQNYNNPTNWTNGVALSMNPSQGSPQIAYNNGNYLMTFIVEGENTTIYYLSLDSELNFQGDGMGTPLLAGAEWSMVSPRLVNGHDGYTYLAYSGQKYGSSSIFLQKFTSDGVPIWADNGIDISENSGILMDHVLIDLIALPNNGVAIAWQQNSFISGYSIFVKAVDSDGNIVEGWDDLGVNIIPNSDIIFNTKNNPQLNILDDKIFCSWEESRNFDNGLDIYGQVVSLNGIVLGPDSGFEIVAEQSEQASLTFTYNPTTNEIHNCWQDYRNNENYNLYCNTTSLESFESNNEVLISDDIGDQISPDVILGNSSSYLVVWEDERNTPPAPPGEFVALEKDVYFQQVTNHTPVYQNNGYPLCDELYKQSKPIIFSQFEGSNSFYMVWMDLRSTGKEDLKNIYIQAVTTDEFVETTSDYSQIPTQFEFNNIYPNPFNPSTSISYNIPFQSNVKVEIINLLGQTIEVIFNDLMSVGQHTLVWNPDNITSGTYLVRVIFNNEIIKTKKVFFIK
tara:strand:- start:547 stop:3684 length:3138 start_codon:yes stop_codon:yes gene_type:complete